MKLLISAAFLVLVCEAQISQNCAGGACGQNNVAAGGGTRISQNCASTACIQNNIGRKKREIADAILALTEETLEAEKKGIQKREAEAQITQNCHGSDCAQNNIGAGNAGTPISQNCVSAACIQNNLLGRKKREIVDAINKLTEEVLEAEEADKKEIQKRESEAICPNYPFCGPSPQGAPAVAAQPQVPGLAAHAAAERAVIAQQSFTGLVGPSGNIGPSGLCGPSGCVQFPGRRKREIVDAINKLTEEVLEAEEADKHEIQKRESEAIGGGARKKEVIAKLLEEAHKVAQEQAEAEEADEHEIQKRAICPNYPFCGPSPHGAPAVAAQPQVPGLAAHAAAERAVIAQQSFTGLVGPSGNIGPSGLCGPSGCVQFPG